ncbi:MAG TPA: carboxymuconolactone decarboxylase family protein [Paenibacillaceae bacterium]
MRQQLLRDGAVSRKLKELTLLGINLAERYPRGVKLHAEGARKCGASDEQIAETALTALLTGGIPAWFEVVDVLESGGK